MKKPIFIVGAILLFGFSLPGTTITWLPQAIRLDVNTPPWPYTSSHPRIAVSGDRIYIAWKESRYHDDPDDIPETDVYLSISHDGGAGWISAPLQLNNPILDNNASQVRLACSGNLVYATWVEARADTHTVFFNRSEDAGLTWIRSPIRINHGHRAVYEPRIHAHEEHVVIAWISMHDIFSERSLDAGDTWLDRNVRIDTGDPRGSSFSRYPQLSTADGRVLMTWSDRRNGSRENVFFNRSEDGGETWLPAAVPLESDTSTGASRIEPHHSACGNRIAAIWSDPSHPIPGIHFNFSQDGGVSWAGEKILSPMNGVSPRISIEGDLFHALFIIATGVASDRGVWYLRGREPENEWSPPLRIFPKSGPDPIIRNPSLRATGNRVYAVWEHSPDRSDHQTDILFNLSTDHGRSWLEQAIRLDTEDVPGRYASRSPQLACGGRRVHVVWSDMRDGLEAIYYNTGLINVPPVTLTISAGPGGTTLPRPGEYEFEEGSEILITVEPDPGHVFLEWGGHISGLNPSIRVALDHDTRVTAEFGRIIHPPLDLAVGTRINRSFLTTETIHELTWRANPLNSGVVGYRIYLGDGPEQVLLGETAGGIHRFLRRNAAPGIPVTYEACAVDSSGREGEPAQVGMES